MFIEKSKIRPLLHQHHEKPKKENKINDKVTIDTTPVSDVPDVDTPNASIQDAGSTDSCLPYSLRTRKFTPYSTNTMKNQKKKEHKIGYKFTIDTTTAPEAPGSDTPNASTQDANSAESNSPF